MLVANSVPSILGRLRGDLGVDAVGLEFFVVVGDSRGVYERAFAVAKFWLCGASSGRCLVSVGVFLGIHHGFVGHRSVSFWCASVS